MNDFEAERMVETAFSGMVGSDSESEDEFYDAVGKDINQTCQKRITIVRCFSYCLMLFFTWPFF